MFDPSEIVFFCAPGLYINVTSILKIIMDKIMLLEESNNFKFDLIYKKG